MNFFEKLDVKLESVNLSLHTHNCLINTKIYTVFDLLPHMPMLELKIHNLHKSGNDELMNALTALGFSHQFLLACSNIYALVSVNFEARNPETTILTFAKKELSRLGCPIYHVNRSYMSFCADNEHLPDKEQIAKFIFGCYAKHTALKDYDAFGPFSSTDNEPTFESAFSKTDGDGDDFRNDDDFINDDLLICTETPDERFDILTYHLRNIKEINTQPTALMALERMTGLQNVKKTIKDITAHCVISKLKQEAGVGTPEFIPNGLFLGNPGTGKTTVAKIIAQLYKEIGLLHTGQLIVANQSDLIGEHVGQTAPKVIKTFNASLGGVLFIDEAYSLHSDHAYGLEAISTLTNIMTEHKGECCVIMAGYKNEMMAMLQETNPGLKERFPFKFIFDDYSADEMMKIFSVKLEDHKIRISKEGINVVFDAIHKLHENRNEQFANARTVENLFQKIVLQQERRLYQMHSKKQALSNKLLHSITKADCIAATQNILTQELMQMHTKKPIGFCAV